MHSDLKQWSSELVDEVVIHHLENPDQEGRENLFSFGFNDQLLAEWGKESLQLFIEKCSMIYSEKNIKPMWFYSWLDEQAGQLRLSAVSQNHNRLPFSCDINEIDLKSLVNGIFQGDSGLFSSGKLNLWKKKI